MANEDATSIQYKLYNEGPDDKYPTYSICIQGPSFLWYNEHRIFNEYGLSKNHYEQMVMGENALTYEYNPSLGLYKKVPVEIKNDSLSFDKFHVQISDFLEVADFKTSKDNNTFYYEDETFHTAKPPFFIGYQTTTMVCFTRKSDDVSKLIRISDTIALKKNVATKVNYKDTRIKFIVHFPGQLLRSLDTPSFSTTFASYHWNQILSFNLGQTTILRKRPKSNNPCNAEIENQDQNFLLQVSKKLGCIPPYWNKTLQDPLEMEDCSSPKQLKNAYLYSQDHRRILPNYGIPCLDMFASVTYNWLIEPSKEMTMANISVTYREKYYEEINYSQDFNIESFISNVGGFVGIFLGYSLMQLPDFLIGFVWIFEWTKMKLLSGK